MVQAVYLLCALTSGGCALMLLREYRRRGSPVLLWVCTSFTGFAISNALVLADPVVLPGGYLPLLRSATAAVSVGVLLFGLMLETE